MNEYKRTQLRKALGLVWRWITVEARLNDHARYSGRKVIGYTIERLLRPATDDELARKQVDYLAEWVEQAEKDPDEAFVAIRADMIPIG